MKLLHTEIDCVPGRKPQKQPLPEGFVGSGTAVLRVVNTTSRQNSYTIRIRCEEPYWQDAWFQISALPPTGGDQNMPPSGKPDQPGPRNQSMTIFVKDGGTRDILLAFFVPEKSECRAGAYPIKVVVETRIVSNDPQQASKERITEFPATAIVRPFYKWAVSYQPEDRRVGLFRRGKEYEVAVDNQGNDWLYCDLKMPRPQNILVETPCARMAIPPPEPGAESIRTVPFKGISRLKTIRGARQPMPLPVTVQRVHAPTVPPLPEEAQFGPCGANIGAAVVEGDTTDIGQPEVIPTLTYCPLIPATLTGFFQALVQNAKGLIFMLIGFILAYNMAIFSYKYLFEEAKLINVSTTQVQLGVPFIVTGRGILLSKVTVWDEKGKEKLADASEKTYASGSETKIKVTISDPAVNNMRVRLGIQRGGWVTLLDGLLPVEKSLEVIDVGKPVEAPRGPAAGSTSDMVAPGQPLVIGGTNFGDEKGKVLLNGQAAAIDSWNDTQIKVRIPTALQDGSPIQLQVIDSNGAPIQVNPSTFAVGSTAPPGTATGGPGSATGGPGAATGGPGAATGGPGAATGGPGAATGGPGSQTNSGGQTGQTGSTGPGSNGGSGNTNPTPSTTPPPGYVHLLPDTREGYVAAIQAAHGNGGGALAVRAYALASIGQVDQAKQALLEATKKIGNGGAAEAMYYLALARVTEKLVPEKANDAYITADTKANAAAPTWAFVDIAIARYKIGAGKWDEANVLLQDAANRTPTPAEQTAIQKMAQQVANKQQ